MVLSSIHLIGIEKELNRIEDIFGSENWPKSAVSSRVLKFYYELLDPEQSKYILLKTFKKPKLVPIEFGSPEIRIYSASQEIRSYEKERELSSNIIGRYYAPYSKLNTYYTDNARGYFKVDDNRKNAWRLQVNGRENAAKLVFPPENPEQLQIEIKKAETKTPWDIQLNQEPLSVKVGKRYFVHFKARADKPRSIALGFSKAHEPWDGLGLYMNIELTPEWQSFHEEFVTTDDDNNARIHFDMGNSGVSVELSDVTLHSLPDNNVITPLIPQRYLVNYRFNACGCRGRDYSIPRPENTVRILVLGDSHTLGVGVHEEDTFAYQLESLLNERAEKSGSGKTYEVINCGVSGYGTQEERMFYYIMASKYEPDIVLLMMTPDDDRNWVDDLKMDNFESPAQIERFLSAIHKWLFPKKYFKAYVAKGVDISPGAYRKQKHQLMNNYQRPPEEIEKLLHALFLRFFNQKKLEMLLQSRFQDIPQTMREVVDFNHILRLKMFYFFPPKRIEDTLHLWASRENLFQRSQVDYSGSLRDVKALHHELQEDGKRMGVVFFRNTGHQAWAQLTTKMFEGLKDTGIPMLDLGNALFARHTEKDLKVHQTDKHPNEVAHTIAARAILDFLDREGILMLNQDNALRLW